MIAVLSDTHGRDGHRLDGRALDAVRDADLVLHLGDFMTEAVLDAFEAEAARLVAVHGNNDDPGVRDRLPATRTVEQDGVRITLCHGHEHSETALGMLARQEGADIVCVGHSHRPDYRVANEVAILNPGSHADPRWFTPGYAELHTDPLRGEILEPDGSRIAAFGPE